MPFSTPNDSNPCHSPALFAKGWTLLKDAAPGWLPAVVCFLAIPSTLLRSNSDALESALPLFLIWSAAVLAIWLALLAAVRRIRPGLGETTCMFLFYTGLFFILSEWLTPLPMDGLVTGAETPEEPVWHAAVEILLAGALMVAAHRIPWSRIRSAAAFFVIAFFAMQPATLGLDIALSKPIKESNAPPAIQPLGLEMRGNIFHIVLDAFSTEAFQYIRMRKNGLPFLNDFIFFEDNLANYLDTRTSRPSFMTGTLYEGGPIQEWTENHHTQGIAADLADAGFTVWTYGHSPYYMHARAARHITTSDFADPPISIVALLHLADLSLLRIVPSHMRQAVFQDGQGVFSSLYGNAVSTAMGRRAKLCHSVGLMKTLVTQEAQRPRRGQYVHAHLLTPHPPYILDAKCNFSPKDANHVTQEICALKLLNLLLEELKRQGKYDDAAILVHADHGNRHPDLEAARPENPTLVQALQSNYKGLGPARFSGRAHCLLLIKPPGRKGDELQISRAPAQLLDIAPTVRALAGLDAQGRDGVDLLSGRIPLDRPRDVFIESVHEKDGGARTSPRAFNHLRCRQDRWRRLKDVPIHE